MEDDCVTRGCNLSGLSHDGLPEGSYVSIIESGIRLLSKVMFTEMARRTLTERNEEHLLDMFHAYLADIMWSDKSFEKKAQEICALVEMWVGDCSEFGIDLLPMTVQQIPSLSAFQNACKVYCRN